MIAPLKLSEVVETKVRWLWFGYLPTKVVVVAGDPGLGKSVLTLDIAARVSSGQPMPNGGVRNKPADVMIASAEDDLADTIKPRLRVAGADLDRIYSFDDLEDEPFVLDDDGINNLWQLGLAIGNVRLIIMDPGPAFMDRGDGNNYTDVRRVMRKLRELSAGLEATVLLVTHLNKKIVEQAGSALYRVTGSTAWTAAARSTLLVVQENDSDRRLLLPLKCNLSKKPCGLAFNVNDANGWPVIQWDGPVDIVADEALTAAAEPRQRNRAEKLIEGILEDGPLDSKALEDAVKCEGISEATYKRARQNLGVKSHQERDSDGKMKWISELPRVGGVDALDTLDPLDSEPTSPTVSTGSTVSPPPGTPGRTGPICQKTGFRSSTDRIGDTLDPLGTLATRPRGVA